MYALVRFLAAGDNKLAIVPASHVQDFAPQNEDDFNNRLVYQIYWEDKVNPDDSDYYGAQILLLNSKGILTGGR